MPLIVMGNFNKTTMNENNPFPSRLYALDALRGIAALAVVFWHWQHFFYDGPALGQFSRESQPFYDVFGILYSHGAYAVNLFFALSGFIFFWLYSQSVIDRKTTGWNFFVLRFSRLYPLHFVTFAITGLLQLTAISAGVGPVVYPENDAYHALLNLLLIPAWGLERGWSFNAPIWSVSVEVMLYGLFFLSLRLVKRPIVVCAIFITISLTAPVPLKVATGLSAFFAGGAAFLMTSYLLRVRGSAATLWAFAVIAAASWLWVSVHGPNALLLNLLIFPASIGLLTAVQLRVPNFLKRSAILGELSYSTYLVHFPLQMIFILIAAHLGLANSIFYSPMVMILYFSMLVALSFASYRMFEAPLQRRLRSAMLRPRAVVAPIPSA